MREVCIVATGRIPVKKRYRSTIRKMGAEAVHNCLENQDPGLVNSLFLGNMLSDELQQQKHTGPLIADEAGLRNIEALDVRAATATGAAALRMAYFAVASGQSNLSLAVGVDKMSGKDVTQALARALDAELEVPRGDTLVSQNAGLLKMYMEKYNAPYESIVKFSVNAHRNAMLNQYGLFKEEISAEQAVESREIVAPLRLYDCAPVCDGAAAVLLAPVEDAHKFTNTPVTILGSAVATDRFRVSDREAPLALDAARISSSRAFELAGIDRKDIDFFEVHDAFSIIACLALEANGFAPSGEGWKMAEEGHILREGKLPLSTMGGLKGRGHPIGATAIYQTCEIIDQLTGAAGAAQLAKAKKAMLQSVGGPGTTVLTHLFGV